MSWVVGLSLATCTFARAGDVDPAVTSYFEAFALPFASPKSIVLCHGFGCRFRTSVSLSGGDETKLRQLLATGRPSPQAERKAIAGAVAWFERRAAPVAGTGSARARARGSAGDPSQFDCIDTTANTTNLLMHLDRLRLLRHHTIAAPQSRGVFLNGLPHTSAVIAERTTARKWVVDPWTHKSGELPDVMPLDRWLAIRS